MNRLIELLISGHHSLVVETASGETHVYDGRGVGDLYRLYSCNRQLLAGARVADKVIGAGAAALLIEGGIKEYYAGVISRKALSLFDRYGIRGSHNTLADMIINRAGTGQCPLESLVSHLPDTASMLPLIHNFVKNFSSSK